MWRSDQVQKNVMYNPVFCKQVQKRFKQTSYKQHNLFEYDNYFFTAKFSKSSHTILIKISVNIECLIFSSFLKV